MEVFIGNLPGDATLIALHTLLGNVELRGTFEQCSGQYIHDRTHHFFVAHTGSRAEGTRLIACLNGHVFHCRALVAQEYIRHKV